MSGNPALHREPPLCYSPATGCPGAGSIQPRGSALRQPQPLGGTPRTLSVAPPAATHPDPSPSTVLTAQPVALPGTAGSCRGWSGRMPAPSLLIICLPSQTKVAPRPVHPARGSRQGAWPSRHGDREQRPVPGSAGTQHPNPALLPWLLLLLRLPLPLPLGLLWEEVGAGLVMQKGEGGGRRNREAQTEGEREGGVERGSGWERGKERLTHRGRD